MDALSAANESYAQGDYLRAFALCKTILDGDPACTGALLLFARLCIAVSEFATATQCLELVRALEPQNPALAELLAQVDAYRRAVSIDPEIEHHTSAYVFAKATPYADHVEVLLRQAIAMHPEFADGHAALGNLLGRTGRFDESFDAYRRALERDPQNARFHLGMAERLRLHNRSEAAAEYLRSALALERVFVEPAGPKPEMSLVALCAPGFWESQIPVDLLVDREHVCLIKIYAGGDTDLNAWPAAVLANAIADPDRSVALADAERLVKASGRRCLNPPNLLARTHRTFLSELAHAPEHVTIPPTIRRSASELSQEADRLKYPLIVRPTGSHRGERLELTATASHLRAYVESAADEEFYCTEFIDYRSPDRYFRKYRFIFVAGKPYPYHLAISLEWMVHYFSAPMAEHAWMRDEEARFLQAPFEVFSGPLKTAVESLAGILELDYFGVDCTVHDNNLLIFEANANMLVHGFDDASIFGYKERAVADIRGAFNAMLRRSLA